MARASTLNAHYTSPTVIKAIYDAVEQMGFKSRNILEPACGTDNFFGVLPDSMKGSNLYGIELDIITGRIAKQLYPSANIAVTDFEKTDLPDSFFDLAIGNVSLVTTSSPRNAMTAKISLSMTISLQRLWIKSAPAVSLPLSPLRERWIRKTPRSGDNLHRGLNCLEQSDCQTTLYRTNAPPHYLTADECLSGNVREKLRTAELAARTFEK